MVRIPVSNTSHGKKMGSGDTLSMGPGLKQIMDTISVQYSVRG
ncbi:hypothetical protein [Desulfobacula sp.]|nr:hypothetical protein [Desulfobacula sp.]